MAQIIALNTRRPVAIPEPEHRRDFYREPPRIDPTCAAIWTGVALLCIGLAAFYWRVGQTVLDRLN